MTREEALIKVKGYLTNLLPIEDYNEVEEIMLALNQESCEDCIRRSDIGLTDFEIVMCNGDYKQGLKMLLDKVKNAPLVIPQPKTGQWIRVVNKTHFVWECNKCGWQQQLNTNYCPDCGVKMEG